jgi:ABC-type polysaccharide/polyol phosphate export permease
LKVPKFRIAVSIAIVAIALLTVWFLVQDIHRLQETYELVTADHSVMWRPRLKPSEIQAMIATRQTAIDLTIITAIVMILATAFVPSVRRNLVLICILICAMIYVSLGVVNSSINPLLGLFTVLFLWGSWRCLSLKA